MASIFNPAGVRLTATHTDPKFAVGTEAQGNDGSRWIYVKANSAVTQYMWVGISKDFTMNPGTKTHLDAGRQPAIAQVAFAASEYGWVAIKGGNDGLKVRAKNSCEVNVALYSTATAGYVDDTSASQTLLNGLVLTDTSTASGAAEECFTHAELHATPTP